MPGTTYNGDVYLQIINHYLRLDAFTVRDLNCRAWSAKHSRLASAPSAAAAPAAAVSSGPSSGAAPAPSLPARVTFISPQLTSGPHRVRTLGGMFATDLRDAIHHATRAFLRTHGVVLSEKQLLDCPATIYHGLDVSTDDMRGSAVVHRIRCTGDREWHKGPPRRDWVWVRVGHAPLQECSPLPYKALQGRLPHRLLRLFKVAVPYGRDSRTYWLAFEEVTRAANSGMLEDASQLVRVTQPTSGAAHAVVNASRITGAAHLIPEEPNCAGVVQRAWVINSHIDLAAWNDVYWMDEDDIATASRV
jgi:hypothetical protein